MNVHAATLDSMQPFSLMLLLQEKEYCTCWSDGISLKFQSTSRNWSPFHQIKKVLFLTSRNIYFLPAAIAYKRLHVSIVEKWIAPLKVAHSLISMNGNAMQWRCTAMHSLNWIKIIHSSIGVTEFDRRRPQCACAHSFSVQSISFACHRYVCDVMSSFDWWLSRRPDIESNWI